MQEITIDEILEARSTRSKTQNKIQEKYGHNLVSMTMNIPGAVKNNEEIEKAFARAFFGLVEVMKFDGYKMDHIELSNEKSGPLGFISVEGDGYDLKRLLVLYEDTTSIGRLLDIDLLDEESSPISRSDIGIEQRRCFLCDQPANICRRQNSHSYDELMDYVSEQLTSYNTWKN